MVTPRILIVDDRAPNRELLETLLGYLGWTAEQAADGLEALEICRQAPPDLLITDLVMPNLGGEDLIRRLRADPATADIPVIIHTASYRSRQARTVADELGVRWVLPKPCEMSDLASMVADALGQPPLALQAGAAASANEPAPPSLPATHSFAVQREAMVNLALSLSAEEQPQELADLFARSARDMLGVRIAGVSLFDAGMRLRAFASRGLDEAQATAMCAEADSCAAALSLARTGKGPGMLLAARPGDFTGLPAAHPPVRTFMACAIQDRGRMLGWMYVADRRDRLPFPAEDERVLLALGAVLGNCYHSMLAMDVLDRRVAERTRELEAVNANLEEFATLVSHDLRAPLANMSGLLQMLRHVHGASLPPAAGQLLDRVGANVVGMTSLIESLLQLSRMSRQPVQLQRVALEDVVRECLEPHAAAMAAGEVEVRVAALPTVQADPVLLRQVFANLLGNAFKYSRHRPQPRVEVGAQRIAGEHLLFVRDNGAGFDSSQAPGLFTPFQRFHPASEFEGTGVGLAVVKRIVSRHGGRIWAESAPDQGACFTFTLPSP